MKITGIVGTSLALWMLFVVNVCAQPMPPGGGGGCTNCPPDTNSYAPQPYVPGLKLAIPPPSGTNLLLNLLEADPAGKYDIYFASNLPSVIWSDMLQGTNGQTNFTLPFPPSGSWFFRTARTDTPITNAANVTVSFPGTVVNTNLITALVSNGPAAAMAVLVNSTNFAGAQWIPFSAVPYVLLGTNDGVYQVWFGFRGSDGQEYWSLLSVTLDTTPPAIVITNPAGGVVSSPIIQLQGYSTKALSCLTFDVSNFMGSATNQLGFVTDQYFDTNAWQFTTNYFQCYDIGLVQGTNTITLHATDWAGNTTTVTTSVMLDYSLATNPIVKIDWPQDNTAIVDTNFTWRGQVDDAAAQVTAQIVDANGDTNAAQAVVERDGKFWIENLPLASGTNRLSLTATNCAGFFSTTNITVVKSGLKLAIDPPSGDLWLPTATVSGTLDDTNYTVWVNGVKAANNGDGTWQIANVPLPPGGTAVIQARAIPNTDNGGNGSNGGDVNPDSSQKNDVELVTDKPAEVKMESANWTSETYAADYIDGNPPPWILNQYRGNWVMQEGGTFTVHSENQDANRVTQTTSDNTQILASDCMVTGGYYTNSIGEFSYSSCLYGTDGLPIGEHLYGFVNGINYDVYLTNEYSPNFISINQYIGSAGVQDDLGQFYRETSQVKMILHAGGKSIAGRQSLWTISADATKMALILNTFGYQTTDVIPPQSIAIGNLGNLDTNGDLAVVLPDNAEVAVTPQAKASYYTFTLSAAKHTPGPCTVSVQAVDDAIEFADIPDSLDCLQPDYIHLGQNGHFEFARTGDLQRPLTVQYSISGAGMDHIVNVQEPVVYFAPGQSNVVVLMAPIEYGLNFSPAPVDCSIVPDIYGLNPAPAYSIGQTNATIYVDDSNGLLWEPQFDFPNGMPVPTNGVIHGAGVLHRKDWVTEVGYGPMPVTTILVTDATLGRDFTFNSPLNAAAMTGMSGFWIKEGQIQVLESPGHVVKLNVYYIWEGFCIGWWIDVDGGIHSPTSVTPDPFTLTVLPHPGNLPYSGEPYTGTFWVFTDDPMMYGVPGHLGYG